MRGNSVTGADMVISERLETGAAVRAACRDASWTATTAGLAPGYVQANLVMLPAALADDFEAFCIANPQPCPLLERTAVGDAEPPRFAPGADIRRDAPRYRVYVDGEARGGEPTDALAHWRDDMVGFLLGCSFTFEAALEDAGFPLRHLEQDVIVPMYRTSLECAPVGPFAGPMVVSMRPIPAARLDEAHEITARYPRVHGAPVHAGDPAALGIADIAAPDWGEPVEMREDEVPVFWACGVTPQAVAQASRPPLMITHAPGHMFVTDWRDHDLVGDAPGRA